MKEIELTQGKVTLVDDDVYEWASQFKWCAKRVGHRFYSSRAIYDPEVRKQRMVYMHREILKAGRGEQVDHVDGDGLNNTRANMRIVTRAQNIQAFQRKRAGTSSQYRGVCWHKHARKWHAQLEKEGRHIHLGNFNNGADAARAYDKAARELFGEYAQPNFPV